MSTVAIDGPSGAGKSTVANALARRLGVERLDTGAMYRAVTVAALRSGISLGDADALGTLARRLEIEVGSHRVLLDGEDITMAIRGEDVNGAVSTVASHPSVRSELVARQRAWVAERGAGVVEGRDITSVVLPDADVKIYLTADHAVRAQRRADELATTELATANPAAVGESISRRDGLDAARSASPLVVADDAVVIDSTGKSVEEVVDEIVALL